MSAKSSGLKPKHQRLVLVGLALVALIGLAPGWHRHLRKQRLREPPDQMNI